MSIQYSDFLVSLVRSLDRADVAVRAASWFLQDVDLEVSDEDAHAIVPQDFVSWTRERVNALHHSLPGLRACVLSTVRKESEGIAIEADALGDACAPPSVKRMFEPVWRGTDYGDGWGRRRRQMDAHRPQKIESVESEKCGLENRLPNWMEGYRADRRAIFFDGELFVIPHTMSDSFVEVWFRRALVDMGDHGPYALYLIRRPYGWECFGHEQ